MKTRIHVNQHIIKRNKRENETEPPLTMKTYKSNDRANEIFVNGPCRVIYSPDKPLSCGAHCWVETESECEVIE